MLYGDTYSNSFPFEFKLLNWIKYTCSFSYDAFLLAKNKPQPVPTSIIHAPLPTQQFGVTLE